MKAATGQLAAVKQQPETASFLVSDRDTLFTTVFSR